MPKSSSWMIGVLSLAVLSASAALLAAQRGDAQTAHGRYLVERVAMCTNCHGPGLQGGPLHVKPIKPIKGWADDVPGIAGLPGWSKPAAAKFLATGLGPDGKPADPPMPRYRLDADDAAAVVAYLRSLKPAKGGHEHHHH